MTYIKHLPENVARLVRTRYCAEFATVSQAGVPIDTPLIPFASADLQTIDFACGFAPKVERARRNPRLGLLFEGGEGEPVVSISGYAAVRDTDFQANLDRYLSEQILSWMLDPAQVDYRAVTRQAIWYFTRVIVCVSPAVVRWWPNAVAMDRAPETWRAAAGTAFPQSDPAPPGKPSEAPWRAPRPWRELLEQALGRGAPAHLTLVDAEGFPLPIRARGVAAHAQGLRLVMPGWLPAPGGKASVSFEGVEIFIGEARAEDGAMIVAIERALPVHPMVADPSEILNPRPQTREALMARTDYELQRRGKAWPVMPEAPPAPTAGAKLRAEAALGFQGFSSEEK